MKIPKAGLMRSKLITLLNSLTLIFSSSSCSFQDSNPSGFEEWAWKGWDIGVFGAGLQPFYLAWDFTVPGDRPASEREKKKN